MLDIPTQVGNNGPMNSTKTETVFTILESSMADYSDQRIIEIIRTLEAANMTADEKIVRIAAHGALEARYPQMVPHLEARIDEDMTYTDLVVDVLRNLNIIK